MTANGSSFSYRRSTWAPSDASIDTRSAPSRDCRARIRSRSAHSMNVLRPFRWSRAPAPSLARGLRATRPTATKPRVTPAMSRITGSAGLTYVTRAPMPRPPQAGAAIDAARIGHARDQGQRGVDVRHEGADAEADAGGGGDRRRDDRPCDGALRHAPIRGGDVLRRLSEHLLRDLREPRARAVELEHVAGPQRRE